MKTHCGLLWVFPPAWQKVMSVMMQFSLWSLLGFRQWTAWQWVWTLFYFLFYLPQYVASEGQHVFLKWCSESTGPFSGHGISLEGWGRCLCLLPTSSLSWSSQRQWARMLFALLIKSWWRPRKELPLVFQRCYTSVLLFLLKQEVPAIELISIILTCLHGYFE